MNTQLIMDLAEEAGATSWGDSTIPATMDIERFAELILLECLEIPELRASPIAMVFIKHKFGMI